eukprot:CAMPEP_0170845306 /NCGR_PEP_ID=MMETSP0734-20130129/7503_1 /TAXON_ID=186038 /ORGANISM="Fragilariopsis kerguelensis, Strain L26-C5" /LENGTH=119 /DNA_ID=CAMNT_0011214097 /DNA_START=146 /DNA_END=505 /DNA_ORIENTATION=+
MALFPTTPTRSSKTTTTAILMSPDNQLTPTCGTNNSCLRRSSRIGKSDNEKIHRKGGVRLFQAQAQERELRSIGNATLPKKRGSSNTTSTSRLEQQDQRQNEVDEQESPLLPPWQQQQQ